MHVTIDELDALMQKTFCAGEIVGRMLDLGRELLLVARCGEPDVDEQFAAKCTEVIPVSELHKLLASSHSELRLIVEDDRNIEKEKRCYFILLSFDEAMISTLIRSLRLQLRNDGTVVNVRMKE